MPDTSPLPNAGSEEEKDRIRSVITKGRLTSAPNVDEGGRLLDAMRERDRWKPSYRYKCVDGPVPDRDTARVECWTHSDSSCPWIL